MVEFGAVEAAMRVGVAALSVFLFVVVALAYRRRPTYRMGLITLAFGIFLIEGLILLYEVFIQDTSFTESVYFAFQFVQLLVLAFAVLKR